MFGVKYASLRVPLERCLETLAVVAWVYTFAFAGLIHSITSIYILIYTKYRLIIVMYLCWIWIIDRHTPETGGRIVRWCKSWSWWKYKRNYFPLRYEKLPGVELDPKKNYLMCCFPHGLICDGMVNAFGMEDKKYFTQHIVHVVTLTLQFHFPLIRELLLSMGGISASAKSIEYVLSKPGGGHICALAVGGAKEASYLKPGSYRVELKNRKGFVKLALRCGAPLVPVISFGETDLYHQLAASYISSIQKFVRNWFGFVPIIPVGRTLFFPHRRTVTTVVGEPLEVPQIMNPTKEDIDKYHAKFVEKLTHMFEEQKYNYLENPDAKKLIIQ